MSKTEAPPIKFTTPVVICLQPFCANRPHNTAVRGGARLRADHPIVQINPIYFADDGLSSSEMAKLMQDRFPADEPTPHKPLAPPPVQIQDEDALICIARVPGGGGFNSMGQNLAVEVGNRVSRRDSRIQRHLDHFVDVVPEGRTRENSVIALTDNFETRRNEEGDFIEETDPTLRFNNGDAKRFPVWVHGQYVDRNHPLVKQHPERFQFIG